MSRARRPRPGRNAFNRDRSMLALVCREALHDKAAKNRRGRHAFPPGDDHDRPHVVRVYNYRSNHVFAVSKDTKAT